MPDDKTLRPQPPLAPEVANPTNVAPAPSNSETVPGGRYIVNGQAVNAEGEPLREKRTEQPTDTAEGTRDGR